MDKLSHIQAHPEFQMMDKADIHAALQRGEACPVSFEVGRLMIAYLDALKQGRLGKKGLSKEELLKVTPDCCRPIEAVALRYAIDLTGEAGLLTVLGSMMPELMPDSKKH